MHVLVSLPLIKQAHTPEPPCLLLLLLPYSLPFLAAQKTERGTERSSFAVVPPSLFPFAHFSSASSWKVCSPLSSSSSSAILPLALQRVRIRPSQPAAGRTRRTWYRPYVHFSYARKFLHKFESSRSGERRGGKLYSDVGNTLEDENTHVFLLFP